MHNSSLTEMEKFFKNYVYPIYQSHDHILDVGSLDVNGSYKQILQTQYLHSYIGLDLNSGKNVDIIATSLYEYPLKNNSMKFVISGQCIEHVQDLHKWIKEISRVTMLNGLICIIGPTSWNEHRHPVDCWRILPDGMEFLFNLAGIKPLEIYHNSPQHDCVGIGIKTHITIQPNEK